MHKKVQIITLFKMLVLFFLVSELSAQIGWGPASNLGSNVNTSGLEDGNSITADSSKLYLSTDRPGGQGSGDIWVSEYIGGVWQVPVNLGSNLNSAYGEFDPSISSDGLKLYFDSDRPGGYGDYDIYVSEYIGGVWQSATNLGANINTSGYEMGPAISADGSKLYFASDRAGGYGSTDIWMSEYSGGVWQAPVNLGSNVNTAYGEYTPSISSDCLKLYFASDRVDGYGDVDIWQSEYVGGIWQSATNLGSNINTISGEAGPSISSNDMRLYFAAYEWAGGYGDFDIWVSEYQGNIEEVVKNKPMNDGVTLSCEPNPVCNRATIFCNIPAIDKVTLSIFDLSGRKVATITEGTLEPGVYSYNFDSTNLSSGIYFLILTGEKETKTEKILIVR